jgi:hypothetical protein
MIGFMKNPTITVIKIFALAYVTIIYGIGGILTSLALDEFVFFRIYINDEEERKKHEVRIFFELILMMIVIGVVNYLGRNILQEIPFPLEGKCGFEYMRVKEVASGGLYSLFVVVVLSTFYNKIKILKELIEKRKKEKGKIMPLIRGSLKKYNIHI